MNEQTRTEQDSAVGNAPASTQVSTLLADSDDFDLPVCTLRPGDAGFEGCEACQ